MEWITKKKIATGFIAFVFAVGMTITPTAPAQNTAHAQSNAELQAQIQNLLNLVAQLQARLAGEGVASICPYTWGRDLTIGSTGTDVLRLQQFLNASADTRLAVSGVGSPGNETTYYGPITANAVTRFQNKYASEVLHPIGLTVGTGYFGAMSRAKANDLCRVAPTPPPADDDGEPPVDDDDLQGGEGDITDFDVLSRYNNEELAQGDTDTVFGFEFEADGSDLSVRRIDILFEANGSGSSVDADAEPWDFIESMTLRANGTAIATVDADRESHWAKVGSANMDSEGDDDTYRMRFSGISVRVDENERIEFTLDVEARSIIDSADIPQNFEIAVADNGIRAIDAAGINNYGGSDSASYQVQMTFTSVTTGDLDLSGSEDFDRDYIARASETSSTDDVIVGMFELEADNQDVTVEDLPVDLVIDGGTDVDNLVTSLSLWVGNNRIDSQNVSSSGASTTVTFDNIDYVVEEDETVTFTLRADIRSLSGGTDRTEGVTVYTVVYGSQITAEDEEGDDVNVDGDWNAGSDPYTVSFYSQAPQVELVSTSATRGSADSQGNVTSGSYTIRFEVRAVGGDIYIPANAVGTSTTASAGSSDAGVEYHVDASGGTAQTSGMSAVLSATGATRITSTNPNLFRVRSGQTATFTLTVNYNNSGNAQSGFYNVEMIALNWDVDQDTTPDRVITSGFGSFQTDSLFLDN